MVSGAALPDNPKLRYRLFLVLHAHTGGQRLGCVRCILILPRLLGLFSAGVVPGGWGEMGGSWGGRARAGIGVAVVVVIVVVVVVGVVRV